MLVAFKYELIEDFQEKEKGKIPFLGGKGKGNDMILVKMRK